VLAPPSGLARSELLREWRAIYLVWARRRMPALDQKLCKAVNDGSLVGVERDEEVYREL